MLPPSNPPLSRPAQVALGAFLAATLGLLVFRGYGNGFDAKPTERVAVAVMDINRADRAELEQVPGIGPSLARAIEDHRTRKGPFKSVEELRQVKGVGPVTFDKVRAYLKVDLADLPTAEPMVEEPARSEPLVLERSKPAAKPSVPAAASGSKKLQPGDPPINLNTAGVDELVKLPGVGPVTAQHIVAARSERPFQTLNDLTRIKGIGPKTLDKIKPFVALK